MLLLFPLDFYKSTLAKTIYTQYCIQVKGDANLQQCEKGLETALIKSMADSQ